MKCKIQWFDHPNTIWEEHFQNVKESNLLQSRPYGLATQRCNKFQSRYAIFRVDDEIAAIFQIQLKSFFNDFLQFVILDRGPLWLDGYGNKAHFEAFVCALRKEFPYRLRCRFRFIPETEDSKEIREIMIKEGFKRRYRPGYQTFLIDLEKSEEELRKDLSKNWRYTVKKAENSDLKIEWDDKQDHFDWFIKRYQLDSYAKGYNGPSILFLKELSEYMPPKSVIIGRAMLQNKPIGAIMLLCHGRGSTYQLGWSGKQGRELGAHNLLLWKALFYLKKHQISSLDLGGFNENDASTIKKFKQGLGGRLVSLVGLYN